MLVVEQGRLRPEAVVHESDHATRSYTALLSWTRVKAQEPDEGGYGRQETNQDAKVVEVIGRPPQPSKEGPDQNGRCQNHDH